DADRRRVEVVAGVAGLRAVRDHREHVHLGPEADVVARLYSPPAIANRPARATGTFLKPFTFRPTALLPGPNGREPLQKVLRAARRRLDAVTDLVALGAAAAADRVVATAGVLDDREKPPAHVRVQTVARRQEDRARILHGVGGVVALARIVGVVTEEVDRLLALEVDDPQGLTLLEHASPGRVGGKGAVFEDAAGRCRHDRSPL